MPARRCALLIACVLVPAIAHAQAATGQRPTPPPPAAVPPAPSVTPPASRPAATLSGGGIAAPMTGLQSFAANGSFLKGLNLGDPAPQCRARCGSDRVFCGSGAGDDSCDGVWRQCLTACRTAR